MDDYGQVLWLPICAGLTAIGVLISVLVWRRRGAPSGLRVISWSLLPVGLYLVGLLPIIVPFGVRLARWVTGAAFSLTAWVGAAVLGLAVLLWIVSGIMLSRRRIAGEEAEEGGAVESQRSDRGQVTSGKDDGESGGDEDVGDIEEILKRRGIE